MDTKEAVLEYALLEANFNCYEYALNACNLSGIVHELSNVITNVLWPIANLKGYGTDWVNTHPIVMCYVDKMAELSGQKSDKNMWDAMQSVHVASDEYKRRMQK